MPQPPPVLFAGLGLGGAPLFDLRVSIPDQTRGNPATEPQRASAAEFYGHEFPDLTFDQAHALLSCGDFARACVIAADLKLLPKSYSLFATLTAVWLLDDAQRSTAAIRWADANYACAGLLSPYHCAAHSETGQFINDLEIEMIMAGAVI